MRTNEGTRRSYLVRNFNLVRIFLLFIEIITLCSKKTGGVIMIDMEMKNVIAENCNEFETKFDLLTMSAGRINASCNNCANFKGERCSKGLYDGIREIISNN